MRLLVCLTLLALVYGAPVPEEIADEQILEPLPLPKYKGKPIDIVLEAEIKDTEVILPTEREITLPTENLVENKEKSSEDKQKDVDVTLPTTPEILLPTENPAKNKETEPEKKPGEVILPSDQQVVLPGEKPEDFLDGQVIILLAFFADPDDALAAPGALAAADQPPDTEVLVVPATPEEKKISHLEGNAVFMQWAD